MIAGIYVSIYLTIKNSVFSDKCQMADDMKC